VNDELDIKASGASILVNDVEVTVNRSSPFVLAQMGGG